MRGSEGKLTAVWIANTMTLNVQQTVNNEARVLDYKFNPVKPGRVMAGRVRGDRVRGKRGDRGKEGRRILRGGILAVM